MSTNLNLFDLKELSIENSGLGLINKLQSFGALHTGPKCIRGHVMLLTRDDSKQDGYKWKCRAKLLKKKNKNCEYR